MATGAQKHTCKGCGRHFRHRYRHKAYRPDIARQVARLTDQGFSVRSIAAQLGISPATVQTYRTAQTRTYQERIATPYPIPSNVLHVVSWSGGKDSSALLVWALEHLPRERTRFIFCDTGHESPVTYRFIEEVNTRLLGGTLIVLRSARYGSLLDLAMQKGRFPSPKARFCTEQLKIIPMIEWILTQTEDLAVYQGIRAEESANRARMKQRDEFFLPQVLYDQDPYVWRDGQRERRRTPVLQSQVMAWLETRECSVERPLFHWKKRDIVALCKKHQVLNPMYDMGFQRVGCFPCIMESKAGLRALAERFPEQIDRIAQAEASIGSSFFPFGKVPGVERPAIKDVIQWARGGAPEQHSILPPCMSGMCE